MNALCRYRPKLFTQFVQNLPKEQSFWTSIAKVAHKSSSVEPLEALPDFCFMYGKILQLQFCSPKGKKVQAGNKGYSLI